jgi:Flp pilus assembly pilin Flp
MFPATNRSVILPRGFLRHFFDSDKKRARRAKRGMRPGLIRFPWFNRGITPARSGVATRRVTNPEDHQEETGIGDTLLKAGMKIHDPKSGEEGQDLVECGLLVALSALEYISGVKNVATAVDTMFRNLSGSLA